MQHMVYLNPSLSPETGEKECKTDIRVGEDKEEHFRSHYMGPGLTIAAH